jgi:hypothetical protein
VAVDHVLPKLKDALLAYEAAERQSAEEIGCPWEPSVHLHSLASRIYHLEQRCKLQKVYGTPKDLLGEFAPEIFT